MTKLSFVRLSDDGSSLILTSADGTRHSLTIDERLRSATRGGRTTELDATDGPIGAKEIQARMRTGATPQEVADMSGWSVDRVTAFAAPVLQERSWIAQKAQACPVGRGDDDPSLDDLVMRRLGERGIDTAGVRWDAWLREDGNWTILLAYPAGQGDRVATWVFDAGSRTLASLDDEARWFTEDRLPEETRPRLLHMPNAAEDKEEEPERAPAVEAYDRRPPESLNHPAGRGPRGAQPNRPEPTQRQTPPQPKRTPAPAEETKSEPPSWDEVLFGSPTDEPGR